MSHVSRPKACRVISNVSTDHKKRCLATQYENPSIYSTQDHELVGAQSTSIKTCYFDK